MPTNTHVRKIGANMLLFVLFFDSRKIEKNKINFGKSKMSKITENANIMKMFARDFEGKRRCVFKMRAHSTSLVSKTFVYWLFSLS